MNKVTQIRIDLLFFIFCIVVLYIGSYGVVISNYVHTPPERYYYGGDAIPLDMTGNIASIRTGYNGHWQTFSKISSTLPEIKSALKMEYVVLGQFARIFRIDPLMMYHISKIVISLCYFVAVYLIIAAVFSDTKERIIAILFSLLAPGIQFTLTIPQYTGYASKVVSDALVFQRMTLAAHHYLLGGLCIFFSLFLFSRVLETHDAKLFVLSAILGMISSFVYAPGSVIVLSTLPFSLLILFIQRRVFQRPMPMKMVTAWYFSYAVLLSLPILYTYTIMSGSWSAFNFGARLEKLNPFMVSYGEYLEAGGLTYIFSFLAIIPILKRGKPFFVLLLPWIFMHPIGEYIISPLIGVNKVRYFLTPYFLVFGMLGSYGILSLVTSFDRGNTLFRKIILSSVCIIVLLSGWAVYTISYMRGNVDFTSSDIDSAYPRIEIMRVLFWLRDNTRETDVVLSDPYLGTFIPAFAGNNVYMSWWFSLSGANEYFTAVRDLSAFYAGSLSPGEAREFLHTHNIAYVYFGYREQQLAGTSELSYPMLEKAYVSETNILYRVKK